MRVLFLQLSDIHVKTDTDAVLSRADAIVSSVRNLDYQVEGCVVCFTGDVAFSGDEAQYVAFTKFADAIASGLHAHLGPDPNASPVPVHMFAVHGNHDCNFDIETSARPILANAIRVDPAKASESALAAPCLEVQTPFFSAMSALGAIGDQCSPRFDKRLGHQAQFSTSRAPGSAFSVSTRLCSQPSARSRER